MVTLCKVGHRCLRILSPSTSDTENILFSYSLLFTNLVISSSQTKMSVNDLVLILLFVVPRDS